MQPWVRGGGSGGPAAPVLRSGEVVVVVHECTGDRIADEIARYCDRIADDRIADERGAEQCTGVPGRVFRSQSHLHQVSPTVTTGNPVGTPSTVFTTGPTPASVTTGPTPATVTVISTSAPIVVSDDVQCRHA
eukprot:gene58114-biopygen78875